MCIRTGVFWCKAELIGCEEGAEVLSNWGLLLTSAGGREISAASPQVSNTDYRLLLNKLYHKLKICLSKSCHCCLLADNIMLVSPQLSAEGKTCRTPGYSTRQLTQSATWFYIMVLNAWPQVLVHLCTKHTLEMANILSFSYFPGKKTKQFCVPTS